MGLGCEAQDKRPEKAGRATYMRAGAGGTDAKLGAETDRHREEDCRVTARDREKHTEQHRAEAD